MAVSTSAGGHACAPRAGCGSIQTRMEKFARAEDLERRRHLRSCDMRGRMTRSRYSVICSGVMFGFCDREIHQREVLAGALDDDRVLGIGWQLRAHLLHLRDHFGQRRVRVGVEPHADRHGADPRRLCEVT